MPLEAGKSKEAFRHNVATEMKAGKPQRQALAIAYAKQRGDEDAKIDAILAHCDAYEAKSKVTFDIEHIGERSQLPWRVVKMEGRKDVVVVGRYRTKGEAQAALREAERK